jgi:predicted transposase YdaD
MMVLPEGLQNQFEDKLENYEEERRMPVLSRIEVRAMQRGEQRGREEGKLLNAREWVIKVLETRFENVPEEIKEAINQVEDISELEQLLKQAITISSVADFQRLLD